MEPGAHPGVVGDVPADLAQQSTSKVPPFWSPDLELKGYPFRIWLQDVQLWVVGTELPEARVAPAVAQRLGGVARAMIREVDPYTSCAMANLTPWGSRS